MKNKWIVIGEDFNSPFIRNHIWTSCCYLYPDLFGSPKFLCGIASENNHIKYVTIIESWKQVHNILKNKALSDSNFVLDLIEKTEKWGIEMGEWSRKEIFNKDLSKISNKSLVVLLNKFVEKQSLGYALGIALPILDFQGFSFVESNLNKFLNSKLSKEEVSKYYAIFTQPIHDSFAQEQDKKLLELMARFYTKEWSKDIQKLSIEELKIKYSKFYKALTVHAKKYSWVYYVYAGPAYNEQDFLNFIRDFISRGVVPSLELTKLKKRHDNVINARKQAIKKLKPSPFELSILNLTPKMIWAKPRRKDHQSRAYFYLEKLQREVGRRLTLSLDQIRSLPIDYIEKCLIERKDADGEYANQIKRLHVCLPDKVKTRTLLGKEAMKFIASLPKETKAHSKKGQVGGAIAYGGVRRGVVRIVNTREEINKVGYGDILVSIATTPAIVHAMKKAAAIVTDEGGLTCHAAIVSRELETPCIVGTKIATKVFKDGDMVEVDADKGIVTKIK